MRPHRRRSPLEHVLVAGDAEELPAIQALMLFLPSATYGQVFVEMPADATLPAFSVPSRITVTMLRRPPDAEPGVLLSAAVQAWLDEWIPEEPEPGRAFTLWAGSSTHSRVDAAGATLERL